MIRSIINKFGSTLYVQIWENRIRVLDVQTNNVFDEKPLLQIETRVNGAKDVTAFGDNAYLNPVNPFSHPRVLLCDFFIAERLLQEIVKKLVGKKLISPAPAIIIQAMEKNEGGLTVVEIRAFKELAFGAGARDSIVYQGKDTLEPSNINFKDMVKNEKNIGLR